MRDVGVPGMVSGTPHLLSHRGKKMSKYDTLNPRQLEAVQKTEGPLLILAGAGSGKTRVLTHRAAYLIEEKGVNPWNILAITFTNKAAGEMKDRVEALVGDGGGSVWVATFHSTCVRILRRFADRVGYGTDFTIYDADDQKSVMKQVLKKLNLDLKQFKDRAMLTAISKAKDQMISPDQMAAQSAGDYMARKTAEVYAAYQKMLLDNNAMDFDDLLLRTVELFRDHKDVLEFYQERFRYIMVDEYQDTNNIQFQFIRLLAGKYHNLCVVGDDDQSIYKFRGADITNILSFEEYFPGAEVIKLEQNYRSVTNILDAANAVIHYNRGRKAKRLWSELGEGEPVHFRYYENGYEEAAGVVRTIKELIDEGGWKYSDFAVLYRTNAQSRSFEEKCVASSVPYRLIGGVNFYQRQEIKDILAYLKTIASGRDELAVRRIINVPKRGIGTASLEKVALYAEQNGVSFFNALEHPELIPGLGRTGSKIKGFFNQIMVLRAQAEYMDAAELIEKILETTGYLEDLETLEQEKAEQKKENIDELISKATDFYEQRDDAVLSDFLDEVSLVADIDSLDHEADRVTLMTLHAAKGLEFPAVFLVGMEDGLFPSYMSINSGDLSDLEEERRLCYVGITRAMKKLTICAAHLRTVRGETQWNRLSRFVEEIGRENLDWKEEDGRFGQADLGARGYAFGQSIAAGGSSFARNAQTGMEAGSDRNYGALQADLFDLQKPSALLSRYAGAVGTGSALGKGGMTGSAGNSGCIRNTGRAGGGFRQGSTPGFGKSFTIGEKEPLSYKEGDRVRHSRFGDGTVLEIVDGKRDYEVTVDFDNGGQKRMFAGFAKLQRI